MHLGVQLEAVLQKLAAVAVKRHLGKILCHALQQVLLVVEATVLQNAAEYERAELVRDEVVILGQNALNELSLHVFNGALDESLQDATSELVLAVIKKTVSNLRHKLDVHVIHTDLFQLLYTSCQSLNDVVAVEVEREEAQVRHAILVSRVEHDAVDGDHLLRRKHVQCLLHNSARVLVRNEVRQ